MSTLYPNGGALVLAGKVKTALATSTLHLYKAISRPLGPGTVIGDFTECDYDGYAAKTITAWNNPYLDPAGGASIQSGLEQFDYVYATGITNNVLGFYLVDSGSNLFFVGDFTDPIAMAANGDAIPLSLILNYGAPA